MKEQEIKTKPPKNATDIDSDGDYWLISTQDKPQVYLYEEWTYCEPRTSLRSLADIKRIVDLEANQERAEKLISELHEQVYDSEYLDNQVELYEALKEPKQ
jgi:hypothetical protein